MIKEVIAILFLSLLLSFSNNIYASHIIGGEISYQLIDSVTYTYAIKFAYYRDCNSLAGFPSMASIRYYNINDSLLFSSSAQGIPEKLLDPAGNDPCLIIPSGVCVEEYLYFDTLNLPPIVGGYQMSFQSFARNNGIKNITNPGATGSAYIAYVPDTAQALVNSGPVFKNFPPIAICVDEEMVFDHSALDIDGDSLAYDFYTPLDRGTTPYSPPYPPVDFLGTYTAESPLDGVITIDSATGELRAIPTETGNYVVGIRVREYRNDTLLSVHIRDFQFNVVDCLNPTAAVVSFDKICGDSLINFPDISMGVATYFWDFGVIDSTSDTSILASPSYFYPDTGVFLVTLIVNKGSACEDSATSLLELRPGINANFGYTGKCITDSVRFIDSSMVASGNISTWRWDFGNGDTVNIANPTHFYNNAGSYFVSLIVVSNFQCTDTIVDTVIVDTFTNANIGPDLFYCGDTLINFINFSKGAKSNFWNFGDLTSFLDTSSLISPTYTYPDTGFYLVKLITSSACNVDSDYLNLGLLNNITSDFMFGSTCFGSLTVFTDLSNTNSNDSLVFWQWNFGNGTSSNAQDSSYLFLDTIYYNISLKVRSSVGCEDSITKRIKVQPLPIFSLGLDTTLCFNSTLFLTVPGLPIYWWGDTGCSSSSAIELDSITMGLFKINVIKDTTYVITACDSNACEYTDSISILVNNLPVIMATPDEILVKRRTQIQLFATGAITYTWQPNDYFISNPNIANPIVDPLFDTIYYVYGTDANGCTAYDSVIVNIMPFSEMHIPSAFTPDGDGLNDVFQFFSFDLQTFITFNIYNRYGQKVFEGQGFDDAWDGTFKNKLQEAGSYIYNIEVVNFEDEVIRKNGSLNLIR